MSKKVFEQYRSRLATESIIKSIVCGLLFGFPAMTITAVLFWYFGLKLAGIIAAVGVFLAVSAGVSVLFYFKKFRPTSKGIARRVDELGLEERMITMVELENDTSYIARRQREDTLNAMNSVKAEFIKIAVSIPLIVAVVLVGGLSIGTYTATALAKDSGREFLGNLNKEEPTDYELRYAVKEGGTLATFEDGELKTLPTVEEGDLKIEVEFTQTVQAGDDAEPVLAVAAQGWAFVGWSDGYEEPFRTDKNVTESKTTEKNGEEITRDNSIYALFIQIDDQDNDDDWNWQKGSPNSSNSGDSNTPPSGQLPELSADSLEDANGGGDGGGIGGNGVTKSDNVYDGQTPYGDATYQDAYEQSTDRRNQDGDTPDELKDAAEDYYKTIEK